MSVHIGSQIRSAEPFGAAIERVSKLVRKLRGEGIELKMIDAGGGLGIDYHDGGFDAAGKVDEYAEVLNRALSDFDGRLLIEPGRFLVAQAGALLARVLYVKRNGTKNFVITDAAMNDLIRPALYQAHHEIVPVRPRAGRALVVDVVGPVCESGDFFARDRKLAPIQPGDLVALLDAGAYGMAQSSNYNSRPRAAEVLVEGTKARLIRRRETMADLLATAGVEGRGVIGTEAEILERARIGHQLGLPAVICLILLHCGDGGRIPIAIWVGGQVMLTNECLLNLGNALRFDGLLAATAAITFARCAA